MKVTIIVDDGAVYKDGISYSGLNLSFLPSGLRAVQWDGVKGELEFVPPRNEQIVNEPEWMAMALTKWQEADDARVAEEQATLAALEQQP